MRKLRHSLFAKVSFWLVCWSVVSAIAENASLKTPLILVAALFFLVALGMFLVEASCGPAPEVEAR